MEKFTDYESFVIYVLARHKDIQSSEVAWAGQAVGWGYDKWL
jgi:hypothetical protein